MRKFLVPLVAAALASGGCRDGATEAVPQFAPGVGPAFAASARALEVLGPGWRTPPESPHGCFMSIAAAESPSPYMYRRLPLRFPADVQASDGSVAAFRYRGVRPDGKVMAVLNCVIPATERAREVVRQRFRVPTGPEEGGVVVQGCVTEGMCVLEPIVVVAPPKDPCDDGGCGEPPPPPKPVGGDGGTGACTGCGPAAPILSCTTGVPRGSAGECTVSTGDGSVAEVVRWEFTDGATTVLGPNSGMKWLGTAVLSGTVTATLKDGNALQADFGVSDRGWRWGTHAANEYVDGSGPSCFNHTPTFGQPNGVNLPMDATDCTTSRRFIQPDSYSPAGDGFAAVTVSGGPNGGFHYVRSARYEMKRKSTYNSGLWSNAPAVQLTGQQQVACGVWANWFGFSQCMGVDPSAYIAGARAHEGWGTTGHNGHFSAAYDAAIVPNNDPMILFDQRVGPRSNDLSTFIVELRREFQQRARRADDATLDTQYGGTTVTGNWSGSYYGWDPLQGQFLLNPNVSH